ncbi:PAS domain-containing protein [Rhizobium sp. BK650]|uniref:PAS domain-containing protein n=1 Tax=Rhizobium sp. BK650 TaxID=2586990 RepID=UPI0016215179|nr:PAS domain-containing protein [Rhizobium sp. BK650]MBB3655537.1 PAS domain-containing protein [Rhizobium sp. BK650]
MLELFRAFSLRCVQIEEAIRLGDDERVEALDRDIQPLVEAILACRASSLIEVYMQLQFISYLIGQDADDGAFVTQYAAVLSYLLDRYFGAHGPDWRGPLTADMKLRQPPAYIPDTDNGQFLNAAILQTLPDRVAVLTKDYRYLYSNSANCAHLGKTAMQLIGRHIVEFIGEDRFAHGVKEKLDACFGGMSVDYVYERDERHNRCRMVPLRDAAKKVMGALITIQGLGQNLGAAATADAGA